MKDLLKNLWSLVDKDTKDFMSVWMFVGAGIICPILLVTVFFGISKILTDKSFPQDLFQKCWDIQKVDDKYFKINRCTGETATLDTKIDKN